MEVSLNSMKPICGLATDPGLEVSSCGVFVSPGFGRHPARSIDSWEVILVERGRLGIAVGDRAADLGPGEWILLPAGVEHHGTADYPRDLRFAWLHFQPRPGRGLVLPPGGRLADPAPVAALLRRLLDHQASPRPDPLVAGLHLALILAELAAAPPAEPAVDELAARAMRAVRARFREPALSTAAVARALGVGADHLGRCFRRGYGITVLAAINRCRLAEAKRLLALGGIRIDDAARSAGFRDPQWLRRLLRRSDGIGPRAWRRLHARVHINSA